MLAIHDPGRAFGETTQYRQYGHQIGGVGDVDFYPVHLFRASYPDRVRRSVDGQIGAHFKHDVDDSLLRMNAGHIQILQGNVRPWCDGSGHHGHRCNTEIAGNSQTCGLIGLSARHDIHVGRAARVIFDPERIQHLQGHVDVGFLSQRICEPDGHPVATERRANQNARQPLRNKAGDFRFAAGEAAAADDNGCRSVPLGGIAADAQRKQTVQERSHGPSAQ